MWRGRALLGYTKRGLLWLWIVISITSILAAYFYAIIADAKMTSWMPANLTSVVAGEHHTCALADGSVYCWGLNTNGQLGNNSTTNASVPVAVDATGVLSGKTVTAVAAGEHHTCALADGSVYCWGLNTNGQLGNNSTTQSTVPVAVNTSGVLSGKTVTAIAAGASHSCVVASDAAYCWGYNADGQLGNNSTTQSTVPVAVNTSGVLSGKTVTAIAAGGSHTCVIANSAAYCWGYNVFGQLGNNSTTQSTVPVTVDATGVLSGKTMTAIDLGDYHTCVIANSAAYCWGYNADGQLGNNSTTNSSVPVAVNTSGVLSGKTVTVIAAGGVHTCIAASDAAYCWGNNIIGQLGNNSTTNSSVPVAVDATGVLSGKMVTGVGGSSGYYSCAIASGAVYCWGYDVNGELGNGIAGTSYVPVSVIHTVFQTQATYRFFANANDSQPGSVLGGVGQSVTLSSKDEPFRVRTAIKNDVTVEDAFTVVESTYAHSCGVTAGSVYCWGYNAYGQLGNNSTTNSSTPVAVDTNGVLAGKTVTALAIGYADSCALASGAVYCWGANWEGELGDGTTTDSLVPVAVDTNGVLAGKTVTAISAGENHSCALASGAVYCWGANWDGELGDGTTTDSLVPVAVDTSGVLSGKTVTTLAAGDYHTCVLADGAPYCWGVNWDGELGDGTTTDSLVPVAVDTSGVLSGKTSTMLLPGSYHMCVFADGAPYCWGMNASGQLGNNSTTDPLVPVAVDTSGVLAGKTITMLQGGGEYTCALADGAPYCWGLNAYGQLGNNSTTDSSTPVAVDISGVLAGKTVTAIKPGYYHACALADGAPYCWGLNTNGQLGNNSTTESSVPVATTLSASLPMQKSLVFKLRYAQKTAATCSAQSSGFADVSTTSAIAWKDNTNVTNGSAISSNTDDPTETADTVYQSYVSSGSTFTNINSVPAGKYALWDFSLRDNSNLTNTSYCLKVTYGGGDAFDTYATYPEVRTAPASLTLGFVDTNGDPVASPSFALQQKYFSSTCQTSTGILGSGTGTRLRVTQGSGTTNGWNVSIAPTDGSMSLWERTDAGASYDFNDPSGSPAGCNSGSDGDGYAGQLTLGRAATTLAAQSGCSTTGLSTGSTDVAFSDSVVDAITLLTASSEADDECYWDIYGTSISQTIPSSQAVGEYDIVLTATVVAQ